MEKYAMSIIGKQTLPYRSIAENAFKKNITEKHKHNYRLKYHFKHLLCKIYMVLVQVFLVILP